MPLPRLPSTRILLVDDHAVVRSGLRMLLESEPGLTVVGEARDREEALALAIRERPEIILLDLDLGDTNGLDLIPDLLAAVDTRILVLTGVRDTQAHRRAFQLGAMGLIEKEKAGDILIKAIQKVRAGEAWMDHSMAASLLAELSRARGVRAQDPEAARIAGLSPRERQIIALLSEALDNAHIAERLFISETTVRHHLTSIFNKLQVRDRLELLVYAYRNQIVPPPSSSKHG